MTLIKAIKKIKVDSFDEFCFYFNISTNVVAGDNGTDEELIEAELNKIPNTSWLINFINTRKDGYFLLQQIK